MGRFGNKVSSATKQRSSTITVNPYELPEKALAMIANICTKHNKDDASVIYEALKPIFDKEYKPGIAFFDLLENYRQQLFDVDFIDSLSSIVKRIEMELSAHENTNDTQVIVAGGFSAGKSSFLNTITKAGHLLPTGIEPVSMISTYLYFSNKVKEVIVKGVNLKDAVVLLDKDVLQCIQHSSSSKVYLASVLSKLFVEIPSDELQGLVFVDTPGYNNTEKPNDANGRSDQETATDSFKDGNVLFWVVDIESGTVPAKDKEMINKFLEAHDGDGKIVIIFNKADKKAEDEIRSIVDMTARDFGLGEDDSIIDVLAYSCYDNKIHYSKNNYSLPQLLNVVRKSGNGNSCVEKCLEQIEDLFETEMNFSKMTIDKMTAEKKEQTKKKDENFQLYIKDKEGCKNHIEALTDIMLTSYNSILEGGNQLFDLSEEILEKWGAFQAKCITHRNEWTHISSEYFNTAINTSEYDIKRLKEKINTLTYNYKKEEYRKEWVIRIRTKLDRLNTRYKEDYEYFDKQANNTAQSIIETESLYDGLSFYKHEILDTLKTAIRKFQYDANKPQDARLQKSSSNDIFSAISSGDYGRFMNCFTDGVSLSTYSHDGFSPLTHAVKEGAIDMVRFFISHNADITVFDKNGYNAFHVAVLYGYRNICELLIKEEPSIATSLSSSGKSAIQLLNENPFNSWLKTKL